MKTLTKKIWLYVLTVLCVVCCGFFAINTLKANVAQAAGSTVTCQGIANDMNNNILEEGSPAKYRTLLAYNTTLGSAANSTNVVSTTGEGITLNGTKLSEIPDTSIDYAHGSRYIQIKIPQSYQDALTGNIVLEVVAGTTFENQVLDASKFVLRAGMWVPYVEPTEVTFTGIQWNNIGYGIFEGKPGVLLQFNTNLSKVQREVDAGVQSANFASTVGETIYLNGAKLSTLPGALVAYHSQNFMFVYADNMSTYRTLTVEAGTVMMDSKLPQIELYFNGSSNQWSTTPIEFTPVTFKAIQWNNIGYAAFQGKNGLLLNYSANLSINGTEYNGGLQNVNLAKTAIGERIKLGGTALKNIEGAEINYHSLDKLWIYAPNMTTLGNITIEETNFFDVKLPATEFAFNSSAWEYCEPPAGPSVVCQGIANDQNNNVADVGSVYRTLIKYDVALGTAANTTNVVSTTGEGILLNGVKLSEIAGASVDYAHGSVYMQIKIPQSYQDALTGNIVLEVVAGTTFENQVLDASKFVLRAGMWVPYVEPTAVTFTGIQWNNIGYGIFEGKPGVLLSFNTNLSKVQREVDANIQSTNFASTVGETIYLNGAKLSTLPGALVAYHSQNFMFVYADNMSTYRTLTVEAGTVMMDSKLPAIELYFNSSSNQWSTTPIDFTPVTFTGIQWNNIGYAAFQGKNGLLLNYSANLSINGTEYNGGLQNVNLAKTAIGERIKLGGTALKNIEGAEINYHSLDKLWIYVPNMTTLGNITIETTNFLDVTLPSTEFTFNGSAWEVYVEQVGPTEVEFTDIRWNELDYGQFGGKNGVLLAFNANLSVEPDEINGSMQSTNLASTIGEYIYLGGVKLSTLPGAFVVYHSQNFMFVYADNMSAYRTLKVEAGTEFFDSILPEINLYYGVNKWSTTNQSSFTPVTFTSIQWNNIGFGIFEGKNGVLLAYSANLSNVDNEYNAGVQSANLVQTAIGEKIKLGGVALKDIAGAEVNYHSQNNLWIYAPNMTTLGNLTVETTNFLDVTLPNTELTFNGSAWEVYVEQVLPTVVTQGIANDDNNNVADVGSVYRTLIKYDIVLGAAANTTNVVSTTGEGILLNGVKLSEIAGASIDYAHGSVYMQIKIPQSYQDALTGKIILEIVEGTAFEDQILDASQFILKNGKWVLYVEPTAVEFTGIQWNDTDYDQFGGKKGVLLAFSANLSVDINEINGSMQSTNLASTIGEYIYLGGEKLSTLPGAFVVYHSQNFMFVYADNMAMYRTLTVESGIEFFNSILPEINLYYTVNQWATEAKNYTPVTYTSIQWNNIGFGIFEGKNGVLLAYSANLSNVDNEFNAGTQSVNLAQTAIGEKIKLGGVAIKDIPDAEINYHSQNNLWIYTPDMTERGTLTIEETNFLDVRLPALTLYFKGAEWTDVALEMLTINYAAGDASFGSTLEGDVTIDAEYLTSVLAERYEHLIVLGWSIGETSYFYGDSTVVSTTVTVDITDVLDFYTLFGASIRMSSDGITGLRFGSRVGLEEYNALYANYSEVELGTYIAPKVMLDAYLANNREMGFQDYFAQEQGSGNATKYVKVVNEGIYNRNTYESDGYVAFYGSLAKIHEVNYYTQFVGVGYVKFVKGGNTYVIFGATDLTDTTRTVYDIAVDAYNDTKANYSSDGLKAIKGYIDAVVDLTYKGGELTVNEVVTGREYTSLYQTSYENGYYFIRKEGSEDVPKNIIINGKKVDASYFETTSEAGSLVMSITAANLSAALADGLVYGVGEPDSILWANNNTVANAEMLTGVTGALNATAFRVWISDHVNVTATNDISLVSAKMDELYTLVDGLAKTGVKEIYFIGQIFPSRTYENYYVDGLGWMTEREYYTNHNGTAFYRDYHCVPNPSTEAAAYAEWLKLQSDYYTLLTAQIAAWRESNYAWSNLKFYFEGLNEPEGQATIHPRGTYAAGAYTYDYFDNATLAKILTDVSYYMTLTVNEHLSGSGFVTTPALMHLTSGSGNVSASGVSTDGFLDAMAAVIKDSVAPTAISGVTPVNTNYPEDYFTVLNWHPYISWGKNTHNEIYYAEIKAVENEGEWSLVAEVNNEYATDWVDWNNNLYNHFVNQFTGYAPKVVFTEFGIMDYGDYANMYEGLIPLGITEELAATVFANLLARVDELVFSNNCTIIAFRLCDVESIFRAEQATAGYIDMYVYGEGNIGFIEEDGTVKAIMREYYYILNGTKDTTALQAEINKYYD